MSAYPAPFRSSVENSALQDPVVDEIIKSPCRQIGAAVAEGPPSPSHSVDAPQLKNEVLAMVAHELRGMLTPLRFGARILRTASVDRPDMLRVLDMIDRQTSRIERLSEDLVDATRVGQPGLRLDKLNVNVANILADSCETAALAAFARGQTFTAQFPEKALRVQGDPVRLAQAVTNLLHNAVKYTPANDDITLSVHSEGNDLIISVRDNGLGISGAHLPHVFELFSQSSRTIKASAGGLGVGLAVVKAIAESHGGTASATSAGPGAGSEFTLKLPIVTGVVPPENMREREAVQSAWTRRCGTFSTDRKPFGRG